MTERKNTWRTYVSEVLNIAFCENLMLLIFAEETSILRYFEPKTIKFSHDLRRLFPHVSVSLERYIFRPLGRRKRNQDYCVSSQRRHSRRMMVTAKECLNTDVGQAPAVPITRYELKAERLLCITAASSDLCKACSHPTNSFPHQTLQERGLLSLKKKIDPWLRLIDYYYIIQAILFVSPFLESWPFKSL